MANQTITNFLHNVSERLINYSGSLFAQLRAVIPYDATETELFTATNRGQVSAMPHLFDVVRGVSPTSMAELSVFGHNPDIADAWETLYQGADAYQFLTSAEKLSIVSDSGNDDVGGSGAEKVTVYGLDGSYAEITEEVELDGTTTVYTTQDFLRVQDVRITQAGATGWNEGTITIADNAGTNTLSTIEPQEGEAHCAVWTVPAGKTAYIVQWHASSGDDKLTLVHLAITEYGEVRLHRKGHLLYGGSAFHKPFQVPISVPEKSDIEILVRTGVGAGNVQGGFEGWYE